MFAPLIMKAIITSNSRPLPRALCTLFLGIATLWAMLRNAQAQRHYVFWPYLAGVLLMHFGCSVRAPAASAIAKAINPDGKLHWGFSVGDNFDQVKSRAISYCIIAGGLKPKIIAATSKRGYGTVVTYEKANGKRDCTASVGAASEQAAISDALRKARADGGIKAEVNRTWHDVPKTEITL